MAQHMLTTVDNPNNPFTEYDEWFAFDQRAGHNTNSLLARVLITSDELSEADQDLAVEDAIDEILREDPLLIFRKVSR